MGLLAKIQKVLFKNDKGLKEPKGTSNILDLFIPSFSGLADPAFNTTFMAAVNAHAKHVSKIQPKVYLKEEPTKNKMYLDRILCLRPNPVMSAPLMWKIVATSYFRDNLSVLYLEWDLVNFKEPLKAIWPLDLDKNSVEFREIDGRIYLKFRLEGEIKYASMEDLIILTREADPSSLLGSRSPAIAETLKAIKTSYEGMQQAIQTSAFIRFIINSTTPLTDEIKTQKAKKFAEDYLTMGKSYGVIYTDSASQVTKVESSGKWASSDEIKDLKNDIYEYQGITEEIIKGKYTENEWQSYYESTLEPFLIELQTELTFKLFTKEEICKGNNIRVISNRLQNASLETRLKIATAYMKLPVYKPNVITNLLYLPDLENGDKEYATLNFVNADKQDDYQGVDKTSNDKEDEEDGTNETS